MSSTKKSTVRMVNAINKGDNVKAYDILEKIMRQKVSDKIDRALKDCK